MTGKRYSVPRGILVLLLCSEVCAVQSTDPGAAVSPSTPGVLPSPLNEAASATGAPRLTPTPNSPLSASLSSTTSTLTATSLTRKVSSTSHLEGTPAPSPQPSASNSAVAVLTGATTLLPVPTQSPGPLNEGGSAGQRPSSGLDENNYGAIFGISVGALIVVIVMCMSIILILDRIARVILKEDNHLRGSMASTGSREEKAGSLSFVGHHIRGNQVATVEEEEENISTSDPHNSSNVASGNRHLSSHKSTSALEDNPYRWPTAVINYKRHHSAGTLGGSHHDLTGVMSGSHICTTIAEVHQNPMFLDTETAFSGRKELV